MYLVQYPCVILDNKKKRTHLKHTDDFIDHGTIFPTWMSKLNTLRNLDSNG